MITETDTDYMHPHAHPLPYSQYKNNQWSHKSFGVGLATVVHLYPEHSLDS
jgi:hypothetical protein